MAYAVGQFAPRSRRDRPPSSSMLAIFAAMALVPTSLLAIAFWPAGDASAYRAAKACDVSPPGPTSTCTVTVPLPVLDVTRSYGRGGNHYYFTLGMTNATTVARVDAFLWWFPPYRAGETVQVEVWDGKITRLSGDGASFITTSSPLSRQQDFERAAGFVGIALPLPLVLALFDRIRRRRRA